MWKKLMFWKSKKYGLPVTDQTTTPMPTTKPPPENGGTEEIVSGCEECQTSDDYEKRTKQVSDKMFEKMSQYVLDNINDFFFFEKAYGIYSTRLRFQHVTHDILVEIVISLGTEKFRPFRSNFSINLDKRLIQISKTIDKNSNSWVLVEKLFEKHSREKAKKECYNREKDFKELEKLIP